MTFTVALWAGGPVYLCSSAAVASLPAQAGSSVVYTAAGFEGPTASLPAKQGNITKSNKLKQQEVSRTACPKSHRGLDFCAIWVSPSPFRSAPMALVFETRVLSMTQRVSMSCTIQIFTYTFIFEIC